MPKGEPLEKRLWDKITVSGPDECWLWQGALTSDGYGTIRGPDKKAQKAHRVAYETRKGEIPFGMLIMHACDTPRCCNPAHLSVGTTSENQADKIRKGRQRAPKGEASGHAILTESAVHEIRAAHDRGLQYWGTKELAEKFGADVATISAVGKRRTWTHVPEIDRKHKEVGK